jgi:hypothetical protein
VIPSNGNKRTCVRGMLPYVATLQSVLHRIEPAWRLLLVTRFWHQQASKVNSHPWRPRLNPRRSRKRRLKCCHLRMVPWTKVQLPSLLDTLPPVACHLSSWRPVGSNSRGRGEWVRVAACFDTRT